jgi:SAM-dependent methyltransferase
MRIGDTVHPFPARMGSDLAASLIAERHDVESVLDPMCGSGTVLRAASERGISGVGWDIDPLAVLMARVWTKPLRGERFLHEVDKVAEMARKGESAAELASLGMDPETHEFILYWFDEPQIKQLVAIVISMNCRGLRYRDALWLALSRTIIRKDSGASRARDVSHSRPHRSRKKNDFDVIGAFCRAGQQIVKSLRPESLRGEVEVYRRDATECVSGRTTGLPLVVTSPPYLNAIDYMRAHRMSLVWMGYSVQDLRDVRGGSVGTERGGLGMDGVAVDKYLTQAEFSGNDSLPRRQVRWVKRFALDMGALFDSVWGALIPGGEFVVVIANSFLRGWLIDNARLLVDLGESRNFRLKEYVTREIPARRRYLPPPSGKGGLLDTRMKTETVLKFGR